MEQQPAAEPLYGGYTRFELELEVSQFILETIGFCDHCSFSPPIMIHFRAAISSYHIKYAPGRVSETTTTLLRTLISYYGTIDTY